MICIKADYETIIINLIFANLK